MQNRFITYLLSFSIIFLGACSEEFLEEAPQRTISDKQLGTSAAGTDAVLRGFFVGFRSPTDDGGATDYGHLAVGNFGDMMSNDATQNGPGYNWWVNTMELEGREQQNRESFIPWQLYYKQVLTANTLINAVSEDTDDPNLRSALGQAYAVRAFCYFNLVRTYAKAYAVDPNAPGIPLYDGSSFEGQPRSPVGVVYNDQIIPDIEKAIALLDGFARPDLQQIDKQIAQGFAARIYLEVEDFTKAAQMANAARQGFGLMTGEEYATNGFSELNGSSEFMWGVSIDGETTTFYSSWVSHWGNIDPGYAGLVGAFKLIDANLYGLIPASDGRKDAFLGSVGETVVSAQGSAYSLPAYASLKFEDKLTDRFEADYIYMRAAEMYLIEIEALARGGNEPLAKDLLLEFVQTRNPDYTLSTNSGNDLLEEIYLQRRIELWGEGQAFYDLKRLSKPINRTYAGSNHFFKVDKPANDNVFVFQIPEEEIQANTALSPSDQNPL